MAKSDGFGVSFCFPSLVPLKHQRENENLVETPLGNNPSVGDGIICVLGGPQTVACDMISRLYGVFHAGVARH